MRGEDTMNWMIKMNTSLITFKVSTESKGNVQN